MTRPDGAKVQLQEVVLRDGLQNEAAVLSTAQKLEILSAVQAAGFRWIEATSFVSPKAVPQLADADDLFEAAPRRADTVLAALVANERGTERALAAGADELNVVISASESHNMANIRRPRANSLAALGRIVEAARAVQTPVNGSVATAFGCPFEGPVPPAVVFAQIERMAEAGVAGVTLADTTGMADPAEVEDRVGTALLRFPHLRITLHFHDTRGLGLANVYAAWRAGARRFDASLGGIGGCPFAPGASGNVATEDVVHMFEAMGIATGIDLDRALEAGRLIARRIGRDARGHVAAAGPRWITHPVHPTCECEASGRRSAGT